MIGSEQTGEEQEITRDETRAAGALVLIVDDNVENVRVLGNILRKGEYRVSAVTDGEQALRLIEEILPDIVLLDILMPDPDGFTVCRRMKASSRIRDIPVIFLTALDDTDRIVEGFRLGAVDYVTKPFNAAELLARIGTHVALKEALVAQTRTVAELREAIGKIRALTGLLPICAQCKSIRDDEGYWKRVEEYVSEHSNARFTHGLCPDCMETLYPRQGEGRGRPKDQ